MISSAASASAQGEREVVGVVACTPAGYRRAVVELPIEHGDRAGAADRTCADEAADRRCRGPGRKRQIVLEHIVQRFEPGRRYAEDEVNAVAARGVARTSPRCAATSSTPALLDRSDGDRTGASAGRSSV